MEFRIPPRNDEVGGFPIKLPSPLRAEGNLSYPQFISLIRHLWEDGHPDIPIRPHQSKNYSKYPCIVYGLQQRTPLINEPKKRFREQIYQDDSLTNTMVYGQRFNNLIIFTAITEGNPELCEAVIETFEDFMLEITGYSKELGVSDMFYVRRLPDREETRKDGDVEERSLAFNVILEKVGYREVDQIRDILVNARVMLASFWQGTEFWVSEESLDVLNGTEKLYVPNHVFKVGDIIKLLPPINTQDVYAHGASVVTIPKDTPAGLSQHLVYQIIGIDSDYLTIQFIGGQTVDIQGTGMGIISGVEGIFDVHATIHDDNQSAATPSY